MSSPALDYNAQFPAHLWIPPDGMAFDYTGYIALPAIGVTSVVVTFVVPEGFHGVIKRLANEYVGAGWTNGSGSLIWQLTANGGVIRNYDSILASLGAVNNPPEVAGIMLYELQLVNLSVQNVNLNAGGTQCGGRLSGWFFPKYRMPEEQQW